MQHGSIKVVEMQEKNSILSDFDIYKLRKTDRAKNDLIFCSKMYKKTLTDTQTKFKNVKIEEMRNIKSNNPRKFGKFLNQHKKSNVDITIDSDY